MDCWPLVCPVLTCEYTAVAEGECCPRCVTDPCLAENLSYDIRQTCEDTAGLARLSGDTWHMPNSPCTTCKCKVSQNNTNSLLYTQQSCLFEQNLHSKFLICHTMHFYPTSAFLIPTISIT